MHFSSQHHFDPSSRVLQLLDCLPTNKERELRPSWDGLIFNSTDTITVTLVRWCYYVLTEVCSICNIF